MATKINEIILIKQDYDRPDPYSKIDSVTTLVEALHGGLYEFSEMRREAVQTYWIEYYLGRISNGGPARFGFNSSWDPEIVEAVGGGLKAIGAKRHAAARRMKSSSGALTP